MPRYTLKHTPDPDNAYDVQFYKLLEEEAVHYVEVLKHTEKSVDELIDVVLSLPRPPTERPSEEEGAKDPIMFAQKWIVWEIHNQMHAA